MCLLILIFMKTLVSAFINNSSIIPLNLLFLLTFIILIIIIFNIFLTPNLINLEILLFN